MKKCEFSLKFVVFLQIFFALLKIDQKIDWKWKEVFWVYWVVFALMIPMSFGFILLLFGKIYQYLLRNITKLESLLTFFEFFLILLRILVKGVFLMSFYITGITINSLICTQNALECKDYSCSDESLFNSFVYFLVFLGLFLIISIYFRLDLL